MKKLLLLTLLVFSQALRIHAQESDLEEEGEPEGKVKYALILPEEKAPEMVKVTEQCPFGGVLGDEEKQSESGEEIRISEMLRSLPVVGKSSAKKWVMLGDLILRKGDPVPPIIANQSVMLVVHDVTPEYIEMHWVDKKPTGQEARKLVIQTDVTPRVMHRLPGSAAHDTTGGKAGPPVMGVSGGGSPKSESPVSRSSRAVVVEDAPAPHLPSPKAQEEEPANNSLLKLFFGTPVSADIPAPGQESKP